MNVGSLENPRIHIEGMGLTGALLAVHLADEMGHTNFTWNDIDSYFTAWKASTGAIYPSGSTKFGPDMDCWTVWGKWAQTKLFGPHCEMAGYFFGHKKPPHEGKYAVTEITPELRMGELVSYHINAQSLVADIRERYKGCRTERTPEDAEIVIVSHGWGERLSKVYWGWNELVTLDYDKELFGTHLRPCFYFRPNKVQMAYAYPVPGTPFWYAGSSIIQQKLESMKKLEVAAKASKWKTLFEKLSGGAVRVTGSGIYTEGWRPAAAPTDHAWAKASWNGTRMRVALRPLWNSGIRHFPKQLASCYQTLGWHHRDLERLRTTRDEQKS